MYERCVNEMMRCCDVVYQRGCVRKIYEREYRGFVGRGCVGRGCIRKIYESGYVECIVGVRVCRVWV